MKLLSPLNGLRKIYYTIFIIFIFSLKIFAQEKVLRLNEKKTSKDAFFHKTSKEWINFFINESIINLSKKCNKRKGVLNIDNLFADDKLLVNWYINQRDSSFLTELKQYYSNKCVSIYKKIFSLTDTLNLGLLNNISNEIALLPLSQEKIWLTLQLAQKKINCKSEYKEIISFFNTAKKEANLIQNLEERTRSYNDIAAFAMNYNIQDSAINILFLSDENIMLYETIDNPTMYSYKGYIQNTIAGIFEKIETSQSIGIANKYYMSAYDYYDSSLKSTLMLGTSSYYKLLLNRILLFYDFDFYKKDSIANKLELEQILNQVGSWYAAFTTKKSTDNNLNFFCLSIISKILEFENKLDEALLYRIFALRQAVLTSNRENISAAINNIVHLYSLLGNEKMSNDYSTLNLYLTNQNRNKFEYYNAVLNKIENLYLLHKPNLALAQINKIQFDSSVRKSIYPAFHNQLLQKIYSIKYRILYSIKSDSAWEYERRYFQINNESTEDFIKLLDIESNASARLLYNLKNREVQNQMELNTVLERQKKFQWYLGIGILVILSLLALFIRKRISDNTRKKEAEFTRVNELAKNKIHNFRSDITDIDILVKNNSPLLIKYMELYKYFLKKFFQNWKKKNISLKEELDELDAYMTVKQVTKNIDFVNQNAILKQELGNISFLQSVFDTLLDNSVKSGFKKKTEDCQFTIKIAKIENFIVCEIIDNGEPPDNNETYLSREGSGLNILRTRIMNFYTTYSKKYSPDFFIIKALPNKSGTYVKLILPYEKI